MFVRGYWLEILRCLVVTEVSLEGEGEGGEREGEWEQNCWGEVRMS